MRQATFGSLSVYELLNIKNIKNFAGKRREKWLLSGRILHFRERLWVYWQLYSWTLSVPYGLSAGKRREKWLLSGRILHFSERLWDFWQLYKWTLSVPYGLSAGKRRKKWPSAGKRREKCMWKWMFFAWSLCSTSSLSLV